MRISFQKKPRETGLRAVCAMPRGSKIKVDGADVGSIGTASNPGSYSVAGWFYVLYANALYPGSPWIDTSVEARRLFADEATAKAAAKARIVAELAKKGE